MALFRRKLRWQSSDPTDPERPSLVTLPAELRTLILETTLIQTRPLRKLFHPRLSFERNFKRIESTNVLETCHQLHTEGTSIFYGGNKFHTVDSGDFETAGCKKRKIYKIYFASIHHFVTYASYLGNRSTTKRWMQGELRQQLVKWPNIRSVTVELDEQDSEELLRAAERNSNKGLVLEARVAELIKAMYEAYEEVLPKGTRIALNRSRQTWRPRGSAMIEAILERASAERA